MHIIKYNNNTNDVTTLYFQLYDNDKAFEVTKS